MLILTRRILGRAITLSNVFKASLILVLSGLSDFLDFKCKRKNALYFTRIRRPTIEEKSC